MTENQESTESNPTFLPYKLYQSILDYITENELNLNLNALFSEDPERFNKFSIRLKTPVDGTILIDYSKNHITTELMDMLFYIADAKEVLKARDSLFTGELVNFTEKQPVLHTALRNSIEEPIHLEYFNVFQEIDAKETKKEPEEINVVEEIVENLIHIENFTKKLHSNKLIGFTDKPITNIVNISNPTLSLGPEMVIKALKHLRNDIKCYFCVNGIELMETLTNLNYETTLFIIVSRNFTEKNILAVMESAKDWILGNTKDENSIANHFITVSNNVKFIINFGVALENNFKFWDWINDRFSLWSSVGLIIPIAIGFKNFLRFLEGAKFMDNHFQTANLKSNVPIILALLSIYYINFCHSDTYALLAYDENLRKFPIYIQQLEMQCNGKFISKYNQIVNYNTAPIVWGERGVNCQYIIGQLLNQGTRFIPCDFIGFAHSIEPVLTNPHHKVMLANFIGQTESLMNGYSFEENFEELAKQNNLEEFIQGRDLQTLKSSLLREAHLMAQEEETDELNEEILAQIKQIEEMEYMADHKTLPGNNPTNSIIFRKLSPFTLGALIALYEHKTFVEGIIWDINSFDNYSAQIIPRIAAKIQADFEAKKIESHNKSTIGLMNFINFNF